MSRHRFTNPHTLQSEIVPPNTGSMLKVHLWMHNRDSKMKSYGVKIWLYKTVSRPSAITKPNRAYQEAQREVASTVRWSLHVQNFSLSCHVNAVGQERTVRAAGPTPMMRVDMNQVRCVQQGSKDTGFIHEMLLQALRPVASLAHEKMSFLPTGTSVWKTGRWASCHGYRNEDEG